MARTVYDVGVECIERLKDLPNMLVEEGLYPVVDGLLHRELARLEERLRELAGQKEATIIKYREVGEALKEYCKATCSAMATMLYDDDEKFLRAYNICIDEMCRKREQLTKY